MSVDLHTIHISRLLFNARPAGNTSANSVEEFGFLLLLKSTGHRMVFTLEFISLILLLQTTLHFRIYQFLTVASIYSKIKYTHKKK